MHVEKRFKKMSKRFSKLTPSVVIAAASLALVLSPVVGFANTPARTLANQTQVVRHPVRQSVYYHTPAAKTENHGRSIEEVIKDQRDWYQMFE
jgi:hypothetical protein